MAQLKAIPGGQNGAVTASAVEGYAFDPAFERALVALCCRDRVVFSRVGALLDPKALADKTGVLLIKAAQAIAADSGEGPSSTLTVIQRLRAWREEGKVTHEQVNAANEFLDAAEDAGLPAATEVVKEVSLLLKKRAKRESTKKVLDALGKGGDFRKLGEELIATERIGEARVTMGESLHEDLFSAIVADNESARLPTGCTELDSLIKGGLPIGYTLFLGREKSGKSMVLSSLAAEAMWQGRNVAIATLELEPRKQMERLLANLLRLPLSIIQTDRVTPLIRYRAIAANLGQVRVARFAPDTPALEVTRWVEQLNAELSRKIDLLVVDYADLLGAGKAGKDANGYTDARIVGNTLRDHALEHKYVTASATQGRRSSGAGGKALDVDDAADSQHKVRIADLVVAMRMDSDTKSEVDWYVILNRDGTDRVGTGALPTCREMARMWPVNRWEPEGW